MPEINAQVTDQPSGIQFGLKSVFGAMTICAVTLAMIWIMPEAVAFMFFFSMQLVFNAACVTGWIYGKNEKRAMAIGATIVASSFTLVVFFPLAFWVWDMDDDPEFENLLYGSVFFVSAISSLVAARLTSRVKSYVEQE